uniref:Zinc_ribbon_16 domain-containing protein n=1 Tax=Caenorhabditis japonica TaxID=281687 RepID=A0A8R1DPW4_CAEJA
MTPSKINGSTRESSKLTAEPGKSCAPDTRQVSDSSSSEKNYKISPSNEKTEGSESTRLSRKHSTRRQLKMGIPSALQLSGNSSLPRPAKPSPERPPILDPPKEVKNYKSPSQRRYYTRIGEDWKSPNSRRPESSENDEEEASASHTDSYQKKQKKKRAKKRKRKPDTPEPTLVLDGTERLSKLTAENLKLLDREYDVEYNSRSFSIVASGDDDDDHCLPPKELLRVYGAIKNAPIEIDNETARVEVDFDPCLDTKIVTAINLPPDNRKFETSLKKFRRMMKSKQQRIKESGLKRQSKQEAAIRAIHQVRKVRFLQTHKTKLMTPVSTDFKPKSILKPATQPVTWWYRIDSEGNKRYLKRFEPSEWQQRMENKSVPKEIAPKLTPKKKISYLKCWANVMNKLGSEKLLQDFKENPNVSLLPEKKKIVQPVDVIIDVPTFGNHPPSRSESWTSSCSSTSSLNSLFDDHPAGDKETGCSEISDTTKVNKTMSQSPEALYQTASSIESKDTSGKNESTGKTNSEEYPVVFFGMTVARSPSPSTSNADALEAIETVAEDGSQIVEYVGQEEVSEEAARHRFDPFVRPLSALFKAFSSTEVGMEAGGRSRSINRRSRLGGFFRRQSLPNLSGLATRPESSSPVRRRRNPYSMSSMSQESSAEDILALMQEQPNALENMEEEEEKKGKKVDRRVFPPLELPEILPSGIPMFNPRKKLRNSLYRQFEQQKNSSIQKKVDEYYSYNLDLDTSLNCSTMRNLVYFNIGEYLRLNRYPRPSMKFSLLGKCWSKSLKFYGASPTTSDRAAAMVSKKVKNSCIRLEKTKRLLTLTEEAMKKMCKSTSRKSRKIRVQYKFKKTCVKYRIKVTIPEKSRKILLGEKFKKSDEITPPLCHIPHIVTTISTSTRAPQPSTACAVDDYDGDNDSEMENRNPTEINLTNKVVIRQNQRQALLKRYFQFAVSMARKVTKRSLGPTKPFMFYAFVSQMKARMRQFMDLRRVERQKLCDMQRRKSILARNGKKNARYRKKRMEIRNVKPFSLRDALKFGNTTKKQVVVEQTKFALRKKNARVEAFFECLDEYIDVGTPIQLVFRSKNTILPRMVFDSKIKMVDSDIYFSQSPCHTDSDFSSDTPAEPKDTEKTNFFNRDNLESTYRVKGLPGLIYLAKLVQARVGDDIERNIPFDGPGMDFTQLQVYMSPIRRLMLNSLGLRMPDRLEGIKLMKNQNEKFGLWFGRLFRMMCYGRGDVCKYIVDILASGQGLPRRNYDKMDVSYQARVVHKLYKKMIYLNNGREARLGVRELTDRGLDLEEENPFAKPFKMGAYDRTLQGDGDPWSRDDWIRAADEFLAKSNENPEVLITSRACVYAMRMIFLGGYSQDIVDDLVPLKIPIRDKLLFIINLTPPDNLVENVIKIFNTVRGLDRLPFVGLGYHADPLQILFDEAVESGDPQLIAHIIRVGRCLDRRSGEPQMVGFNSDHVKKRDFAEIMTDIFANSDAKKPCGAPTMDEMFPFRFVRHDDGTHVAKSTEELANIMECEVTRYMAILELTKGAAVTKGDLDHNKKFNTRPSRFFFDILCTGCKVSVAQARNLGSLGRTLCVSTMPLIEQDKDKKRWPNAKTMSPRLTFENYIETLDPTENKMLMAKDIEEEKTDITVQLLPSRFGCYQCRFSLPRCAVCMCPYLNDHMDYALKEKNERFSQFSVCNICNHGGHINHISEWFATEKFCPVAGCDCRTIGAFSKF